MQKLTDLVNFVQQSIQKFIRTAWQTRTAKCLIYYTVRMAQQERSNFYHVVERSDGQRACTWVSFCGLLLGYETCRIGSIELVYNLHLSNCHFIYFHSLRNRFKKSNEWTNEWGRKQWPRKKKKNTNKKKRKPNEKVSCFVTLAYAWRWWYFWCCSYN